MATLVRQAQAGIEKKYDAEISVSPAAPGTGVKIKITSPAANEFSSQIAATIQSVFTEQSIWDADVVVKDKGALDFALRARTETAIRRALQGGE